MPATFIISHRPQVTIGRGIPKYKICIDVVSGHHLVIERQGNNVYLTDTSTNGTYIDRGEERLERGTRIAITHMTDIALVNPRQTTSIHATRPHGCIRFRITSLANDTEPSSRRIPSLANAILPLTRPTLKRRILTTHRATAESCTYTFIIPELEREETAQGGPMTKYEMGEVIGTGQFAKVRRVFDRKTRKQFACKIIEKAKANPATSRSNAFMDEVEIITKVSHENIISVEEIFETDKFLYLVLELVTGGELFDLVVNGALKETRALNIIRQCLLGVRYLHLSGIAHRDLKPENILLLNPPHSVDDPNGADIVKISDFGLSRLIDEDSFMKTICGTPQYVAPEILTANVRGGYGPEVDMWSLVCPGAPTMSLPTFQG